MFVKSKFLTGDVKVTEIIAEDDNLKVIGSIKGLYPIEVTLNKDDLAEIVKVSLKPDVLVKSGVLLAQGLLSS